MSVVESGVKQKDASSENNDSHGNENENTEDADTFALKFGETDGLGLKFLLRHGMNNAIIRGRQGKSRRNAETGKMAN